MSDSEKLDSILQRLENIETKFGNIEGDIGEIKSSVNTLCDNLLSPFEQSDVKLPRRGRSPKSPSPGKAKRKEREVRA